MTAPPSKDSVETRLESPLPPVKNHHRYYLSGSRSWGFEIIRTYPDTGSTSPSSQLSVTLADDSVMPPPKQPVEPEEELQQGQEQPLLEGDPELLQIREVIRSQALRGVKDLALVPRLRLPIRHLPQWSIRDIRELLEREGEERPSRNNTVVDPLDASFSYQDSAIVIDAEVLQHFRDRGEENLYVKIIEATDSEQEEERNAASAETGDWVHPGWMRAHPGMLLDIYESLIAEPLEHWFVEPEDVYGDWLYTLHRVEE
jgi:hypothetical protein